MSDWLRPAALCIGIPALLGVGLYSFVSQDTAKPRPAPQHVASGLAFDRPEPADVWRRRIAALEWELKVSMNAPSPVGKIELVSSAFPDWNRCNYARVSAPNLRTECIRVVATRESKLP